MKFWNRQDSDTISMADQNVFSTVSVLTIGLVFGLKHAVEADHIAAVSTIVSERKSLLASSLVGGLWGVGHTISLLIAGVAVLLLLSTISSPAVGLAYIAVFGIGSIGGMIAMSALVSLPVHLTAGHFNRANKVVRTLAAIFSLGLGLFMAYRISFLESLFRP